MHTQIVFDCLITFYTHTYTHSEAQHTDTHTDTDTEKRAERYFVRVPCCPVLIHKLCWCHQRKVTSHKSTKWSTIKTNWNRIYRERVWERERDEMLKLPPHNSPYGPLHSQPITTQTDDFMRPLNDTVHKEYRAN